MFHLFQSEKNNASERTVDLLIDASVYEQREIGRINN